VVAVDPLRRPRRAWNGSQIKAPAGKALTLKSSLICPDRPIWYVHEVREVLVPKLSPTVLYLTANPDLDLRTEAEVRSARDVIRRATHRNSVVVGQR
jgi:hypothetical protein